MNMMFSLGDVIAICVVVAGVVVNVTHNRFNIGSLKKKWTEWETVGLPSLKLYIEQELGKVVARFDERIKHLESRVGKLEDYLGIYYRNGKNGANDSKRKINNRRNKNNG